MHLENEEEGGSRDQSVGGVQFQQPWWLERERAFCVEVDVRRTWQLLRGNKDSSCGGYFARLPRGT